jgi:hypothetical protein
MINNSASDLSVAHVKSETNTLNLNTSSITHYGALTVTVNYFNYLPADVVVVQRNGFRCVIKSVTPTNQSQKDFIVRCEYRVRHDAIDEIRKTILRMDLSKNDELSIIQSAVIDTANHSYHSGLLVVIETRYSLEEFRELGKNIYCPKRDIVISLNDIESAPTHPHCVDTINGNELILVKECDVNIYDFATRIELIDNNNQIKDKYIFYLNEVRLIKPKIDYTRRSGVYIYSLKRDSFRKEGCYIHSDFHTLAEAEEKKIIFDTFSEAQSGGDIKETRKQEILNLEYEISVNKRLLDQEKSQREIEQNRIQHERAMENAEWEQKLKILQRELDHTNYLREQESKERKDYYERNSQQRKDTIDIIKFLPQLIITMGAVVVAFYKLTSTMSKS